MFRRPRRPFAAPNSLPPAMSQALNEVERLAASGQVRSAADMLVELAQGAGMRGRLRWAANLNARAAHLYVEAGMASEGIDAARQALQGFIQVQMVDRARQFYNNLMRRLRTHGMQPAASALEGQYGSLLGAAPSVFQAGSDSEAAPAAQALPQTNPDRINTDHAPGRLPAECPGCGAPVRSDRVEWIDATSAECSYCGGVILAE